MGSLHHFSLDGQRIADEANVDVRRAMIERVGAGGYFRETRRARCIDDDPEWGKLWVTELRRDEPLVVVELVDGTVTEGGRRTYLVSVPPTVRTSHEAAAWTFGYERPEDYEPEVQT